MRQEIADLLRAKHDPAFGPLSRFAVVIAHRGAPGDEKTIDGSDITEVRKNGFCTGETFIPSHRIKRIYLKNSN